MAGIKGFLLVCYLICTVFYSFAQVPFPKPLKEEKTEITLETEGYLYFVARGGGLNEVHAWSLKDDPATLPPFDPFTSSALPSDDERKGHTFFGGIFNIKIDVKFTQNLRLFGEIENKLIDELDNIYLGQDETRIYAEQAFLEVGGITTPESFLRIGIQDIKHSVRPNGDAFVLDITESESAIDLINQQLPFLPRDTLEPVGIRIQDIRGSTTIDFFHCTTMEGGPSERDEHITGLIVTQKPNKNTTGSIILLYTLGGAINPDGTVGKNQDIMTFGFAVDLLEFLGKDTEFYIETYMHRGHAGRRNPPGTPKDITYCRGRASRIGILQKLPQSYGQPWFEISAYYISGDANPDDEKEERFFSYENIDDFLIIESNDYGLDVDTNVRALRCQTGFRIKISPVATRVVEPERYAPLTGKARYLDITIRGGIFEVVKEIRYVTLAGVVEELKDYGYEVDLLIKSQVTENLSWDIGVAFLRSSDLLKIFTSKEEDDTYLFLMGAKLIF